MELIYWDLCITTGFYFQQSLYKSKNWVSLRNFNLVQIATGHVVNKCAQFSEGKRKHLFITNLVKKKLNPPPNKPKSTNNLQLSSSHPHFALLKRNTGTPQGKDEYEVGQAEIMISFIRKVQQTFGRLRGRCGQSAARNSSFEFPNPVLICLWTRH